MGDFASPKFYRQRVNATQSKFSPTGKRALDEVGATTAIAGHKRDWKSFASRLSVKQEDVVEQAIKLMRRRMSRISKGGMKRPSLSNRLRVDGTPP